MLGYFLFKIFTRVLHQSCLLGVGACDACASELFAGVLRSECACACELFAGGLRSECTCGACSCELFAGGLRSECACAYELFAGGLRFECTCGACACELFPSLHQWKLDVKILLCEMSYLSIYHIIIRFLGFAQISCMNVLVNLNLLLLWNLSIGYLQFHN